MQNYDMPKLIIDDLEISKPIIQGGMGVGISMSGLASAVTNQGGLGVISSVGLGMLNGSRSRQYREANKQLLINEIRKARTLTNGLIGANIMVALADYDEILKTVLNEKIDIIFIGAGLPLRIPSTLTLDFLASMTTKVAVIVSSARATDIIFRSWENKYKHVPDIVIVEGPMAGGHLGFKREQIDDPNYKLEKIVPDVIKILRTYRDKFSKSIPVIAAGGIYTGEDIYKFINMGAAGVQMATRFVATYECDASVKFKDAYTNCSKDDIIIIQSPVGLPGRAIKNKFLDDVFLGKKKPFNCSWKCLRTCDFKKAPYCIASALANAQKGILTDGFAFAGSNAYRLDKIISVKELFHILENEYQECAAKMIN